MASSNSKNSSYKWSSDATQLSITLHKELTINNKDWHKYRGDKKRRIAELLAASLVQLINNGDLEDVQKIITQAQDWINGNSKDTGCIGH